MNGTLVSAANTSPREVIVVISEAEFENQIFISFDSFPFKDQL